MFFSQASEGLLLVYVSKVICNAVAEHTLGLGVICHPNGSRRLFLVFDRIELALFDVYLFSCRVVANRLVVASVHRIAAFEWTVLRHHFLDRLFLSELLIGSKSKEVRVKSSMLSHMRSKWLVSFQDFFI